MDKKHYLDTPLMKWPDGSEWTIRQAVCNLVFFGGIGSGKSSSANTIANKYLSAGWGGLVLCAKDELSTWREYCKRAGREKDLIVVKPGGKYHFDPLAWECHQSTSSGSITKNLVALLETILNAGKDRKSGTENQFFETAQTLLLNCAVDLNLLAYKTVSVQTLYDIVLSAPAGEEVDKTEETPFKKAFQIAHENVALKVEEYQATLSEPEKSKMEEEGTLDAAIIKHVPDYRTLLLVNDFFNRVFKKLTSKTRDTVVFSFQAFLLEMMREPFFSLFCSGASNFSPVDAINGKIILIHMPVRYLHQAARDIQIALKYCFTRAWEQRPIEEDTNPVFLWQDEGQEFMVPSDAVTSATSRSSRIANVLITQNIPGCHAVMGGGDKSPHRVNQLLGTFATKFFCANADVETNKYASELIGEHHVIDPSSGMTMADDVSVSFNESQRLHRQVRPEEFAKLSCRDGYVEAIMHIQGPPFADNRNHKKIRFKQ